MFNTAKRITLFFIVQSLLHRNPPNIWSTIIHNAIQIECLYRTQFFDLDRYLDCDLDKFSPCKRGIGEQVTNERRVGRFTRDPQWGIFAHQGFNVYESCHYSDD